MDQKAFRLECALAGPNVHVSCVPAKCWVEIKSMKLSWLIQNGSVEEFEFTTPDGEYALCVWRGEVAHQNGQLWVFDSFALGNGVEDSGIVWVREVPKESLVLQCEMAVRRGTLLQRHLGHLAWILQCQVGPFAIYAADEAIEVIAKKWAINENPKMASRNQVVHLVLDGFNGRLKPSTLVWSGTIGNKVTKRLSRKTCVEGRWFEKRLESLRQVGLNTWKTAFCAAKLQQHVNTSSSKWEKTAAKD